MLFFAKLQQCVYETNNVSVKLQQCVCETTTMCL